MKYTAVIVEDEELPRLTLQEKIRIYHPDIQIIGTYDNCDSALDGILKHKPDLMFLDIQLPEKNSLWLIETLKTMTSVELPYIIFTTANTEPEFLLKAVKLSAIDYLLKPVALDELAAAIQKVKNAINEVPKSKTVDKTFSFKTLNSVLLVKETDIVYCEADGNYCQLLLSNNHKDAVFERFGDVADKICSESIIRAGRSHLINTHYISKIDTKKQLCYFKISSPSTITLRVSDQGMKDIMAVL